MYRVEKLHDGAWHLVGDADTFTAAKRRADWLAHLVGAKARVIKAAAARVVYAAAPAAAAMPLPR